MSKIKLSIIALSCALALSACSSSSKGGSDNSDQIRQTENELNQRISAANKKAEEAVKKAETAINTAKANGQQTEEEKKAAEAEKKAAEEALKAAEERLKKLENLQADEKARIPLSDKVFGGISGEMKDTISGGTINLEKNELNSVLTANIRELTIRDEDGRLADINILRRAGDMDPESFEPYNDQYNLRKERQTILSNSNFKSSAFGAYYDTLTGNRYFFAQGLPTAVSQIPTAGQVEYKGGAVYKKDGEQNYSELSEMTATADFATKVIDINIAGKTNALPGMNFGGKISGNSFAGNANGIKTQGGFFGENAQEMTGLFINEADQARGAFGGIKQ